MKRPKDVIYTALRIILAFILYEMTIDRLVSKKVCASFGFDIRGRLRFDQLCQICSIADISII